MDPKDEKKVTPQAPAQGDPPSTTATTPPASTQPGTTQVAPPGEVKPQPSGLDALTVDQLKEIYKRTPQLFEEAGITLKKVETPPAVEPAKKVEPPPPPPVSAAPKYGDTEIALPSDVPVNRESVNVYLKHALEIGLTAKQVQAEIDFQVKQARDAIARQPQVKTLAELDAENVAALKADPVFGKDYDKNKETALRAATKWGDAETLKRLQTSDPVLIKHFWKLGQADAEDTTRGAPNRTGTEGDQQEEAQQDYLAKRYPTTAAQHPELFAKNR